VPEDLQLVHQVDERIDVRCGNVSLLSYVYGGITEPTESPRPYLHPVRTLGGRVITGFRPHDHPWHRGISMTAHLSGQNFWGGDTWVPERGYVQLHNNGRMEHESWQQTVREHDKVRLVEQLIWRTVDAEPWAAERRVLEVAHVNLDAQWYALSITLQLRNIAGRDLAFSSPATEGLEQSGYGGLFWRGPRSFIGGDVFAQGGFSKVEEVMGRRAAWLAFVGRHDESLDESTLVFADDPGNPRFPTEWFVRSEPIPCVCFPLAYAVPLPLPADTQLDLRYTVLVADGRRDAAAVEAMLEELEERRWVASRSRDA